jgi:hypothetical protein
LAVNVGTIKPYIRNESPEKENGRSGEGFVVPKINLGWTFPD